MRNLYLRFFAAIALLLSTNALHAQIIDETFEEAVWQGTATLSGQVVITSTSVNSTVTYGSVQGANITSLTRLNTVPNSGTWWYARTSSNSGSTLDRQHSFKNSIRLSSSGYVITPVTKTAFVSVTFWASPNSAIGVGINTNTTAAQPTFNAANSVAAGFTYASQVFAASANTSMTSYNYTGTFSGPARIGFFNAGGVNIYIDDIKVTAPTGTPPVVTTNTATPTQTTALLSGTITPGTMPLGYSGFIWSTNVLPLDTSLATKTKTTPAATGSYSYNLTGLSCSVTYYYRAYVIDLVGTVYYGNVITFTTPPCTAPVITTTAPFNIGGYKVYTGGNISDSGGLAITQKGVVWNTTGSPTLADNKTTEGITGVPNPFASVIAGLDDCTSYYVRAYATNSMGTTYGNEINFTTDCDVTALVANPLTLDFGSRIAYGSASSVINYSLTGYHLIPGDDSVTVTSSSPTFTISDGPAGPFVNSFKIPYTDSTLPTVPVYIKMATNEYGYFTGYIYNSGGGATGPNVDTVTVTGTVVQDPSVSTNTGTDFWTGFGYMYEMQNTAATFPAGMELFIAAPSGNSSAQVVVDLPGVPGAAGFPKTVTVVPGTITTINNFPLGDPNSARNAAGLPDSRLYYTGVSNRGIHIYSTNGVPIAVWMHTFASDNTAAGAMLFPSSTWNSGYIVQAEGGSSNTANPNSFFFVVANEDNTPIWIKPSKDILDSSAASIFTQNNDNAANLKYPANGTEYGPIYLNKGQVFNAMGAITGTGVGLDLSGSTVRTTCDKKIGVFGGNGRCYINGAGCSGTNNSDNMIQQMFPSVAWGTYYLTVPTKTMEYNLYRVFINPNNPGTHVKVNGTPVIVANGLYYEFSSNQPTKVESDTAINVIQFIVSGPCAQLFGSKGNGDPEFIILSPTAQSISSTSVYSTGMANSGTSGHYINVIIRQGGIPSFQLDGKNVADTGIDQNTVAASSNAVYNYGGAVPIASCFVPHPQDPGYYYAKFRVDSLNTHTLYSDSGFVAMAYGMSAAESYGYNAGTQLRDLSEIQLVDNAFGRGQSSACKNSVFHLRVAIPYAPGDLNSLQWQFSGNQYLAPNTDYTMTFPSATNDSTFVINGATYYVYTDPTPYTFSTTGSLTYQVVANTKSNDGCGGVKSWKNILLLGNGAAVDFKATLGTCGNTKVLFNDLSVADPGTTLTTWKWNFGDPGTLADTATHKDTAWTYSNTLSYNVSLRVISSIGCYWDYSKVVDLAKSLKKKYRISATTIFTGGTVTFKDSTVAGGSNGIIVEWDWNFGDGSPTLVTADGGPVSHQYNSPGTYYATLNVVTSNGCHYSVYQVPIVVQDPVPVTFIGLSGSRERDGVRLNWKVGNEIGIDHYEVERSLTGNSFGKLANKAVAQAPDYSWLDVNPNNGVNFYRIKAVDISGKVQYTNIVKVTLNHGGSIAVVPNPITGTSVNLQFDNQPRGNYTIRLVNSMGQELCSTHVNHSEGSSTESFNIPSTVAKGIYAVEITLPDNSREVMKVVVN